MTDQPQFDPAQYKKTTTEQWDAAAKAWDDWDRRSMTGWGR